MWKQLFIFPLGLTKDLSQIYYDSPTDNNSIQKNSINQQQQNIKQFTWEGVSKYTQEMARAEIPF